MSYVLSHSQSSTLLSHCAERKVISYTGGIQWHPLHPKVVIEESLHSSLNLQSSKILLHHYTIRFFWPTAYVRQISANSKLTRTKWAAKFWKSNHNSDNKLDWKRKPWSTPGLGTPLHSIKLNTISKSIWRTANIQLYFCRSLWWPLPWRHHHISRCASWPWKKLVAAKEHDALDLSGERIAIMDDGSVAMQLLWVAWW